MALDQTKCWIGVPYKLATPTVYRSPGGYSSYANAVADTANAVPNPWPLEDLAFTPDMLVGQGETFAAAGNFTAKDPTLNQLFFNNIRSMGLLVAYDYNSDGTGNNPRVWYAPSSGTYATSTQPPYVSKPLEFIDNYQRSVRIYDRNYALLPESSDNLYFEVMRTCDVDDPTGNFSKSFREICPVAFVQMPYNQELTTFTIQQSSPTTTTIQTLDGASRQYITGNNANQITATFKWSDDGIIAKNLNEIIKVATKNALPLVIYLPSNSFYDTRIEMIVPSTIPVIKMIARTTYEVTIEGRCQP